MTAGQAGLKKHEFEFTGKGGEYFKIWIVNILLSIITLGIYSAWAKVRNKRYFYGNTSLNNASFEYTALPMQILKGRIIAVGALGVFNAVSSFMPTLGLVLFLLLFIATPWIVMKALAFNAKNSRYQNIHFNFKQKFKDAAIVFILFPILALLTAYLLLPYVQYRIKKYIVANHYYGKSEFKFTLDKCGAFYGIYIVILLTLILLILLVALLASAMGGLHIIISGGAMGPVLSIVFILFYLFVFAYMNSQMYNLTYNHAAIDAHKFSATMSTKGLAWIYFTNTLGIILTLGLFIPWAKVRSARYRAANTYFHTNGDLDHFIAQEVGQDNVLAEELGEQFGDALDIDIGI